MTTKKGKGNSKKQKQMRGLFASLRMTTKKLKQGNRDKILGYAKTRLRTMSMARTAMARVAGFWYQLRWPSTGLGVRE